MLFKKRTSISTPEKDTNSTAFSTVSSISDHIPTPVEDVNPLSYSFGPFSVVILILQGLVGTGIFATPGTILKLMGSVGSTYVLWITCFFIPLFSSYLYIEFAGYFPKRNGGDVAYLEAAYPRPKFLVPTVYAAISVVLSFTTSSALAFGRYVLLAADAEVTTWHYRGIAIGALTFACIIIALNTNAALKLQNLLGIIKVLFMLFICVLGWVILAGGTRVQDPKASFRNMWEGTTTDGNNITKSIINVVFSYGGYRYAFGVVAEFVGGKTKDGSPVDEELHHRKLMKTYGIYVPVSLFVIFILYILMITSYYASAPPEEIKNSGMSVASLLFENAFNNKHATTFLDVMVAFSAFGHLLTAIISHSRGLRECGRQGVLPFPKFWTSTKPFNTPLGPIFITWLVNFIMIIAPPAGVAYQFIVDMGSYSGYIFTLCAICGLLTVRRDRRLKGLGNKGHYLPLPAIIILLLFEIMVIVMAFIPPKEGLKGSNGQIFYATYPIVTIGLIILCVIYYFVWRYTLPNLGGYVHREVIYRGENGEIGNTIVKVKLDDLEQWDKEHSTDDNGVGIVEELGSISSSSLQRDTVFVEKNSVESK
ncbi:hypothetical protein CANINC_000248 [Pichia inconspicua]|uniref:Amino acid permease/ SLC12A domain-containing protein n=1 Tax=Pichia inconspicua TaxID=52247 RepID=A0A4V4NG96_9ASCO|nr:hypothetical protein CANINC_000248 [[Candida] inconspicua]